MTFLWHDYETFGTHPAYDRPVQFAALRTDEQLRPVGAPLKLTAQPARDSLPHPFACLVTGITPQQAERDGIREAEFAGRIHEVMMEPGTCAVGYNSLRFDDAVTRHLFYRNFIDPYEREWKNGNSRWDLIDVARLCYALRPAGVAWPERAESPGVPSFRLEDLTAANGIDHGAAHDALADVQATIELARRLRRAQPRLFAWALTLRDRDTVSRLLDPLAPRPLLHTSGLIEARRGCTTLVMPVAPVTDRPREVVVFDLMADPAPLFELDAAGIAERVFTRNEDLPEENGRLPLMTLGTNRVPMLAPAATLRGVDQERIGLDAERCRRHARQLRERLDRVRGKLRRVFVPPSSPPPPDPDGMLYSGGFFSDRDRRTFDAIRRSPPERLANFTGPFDDPRVPEMLFRYRARNWPESLSPIERERWDRDRLDRLNSSSIEGRLGAEAFRKELEAARAARQGMPRDEALLRAVENWALELLEGRPERDEADEAPCD